MNDTEYKSFTSHFFHPTNPGPPPKIVIAYGSNKHTLSQ